MFHKKGIKSLAKVHLGGHNSRGESNEVKIYEPIMYRERERAKQR